MFHALGGRAPSDRPTSYRPRLTHYAPYEIQVDGIAELWFKDQAAFDAYSNSPATKRLRDDGATFIGREIDFITEEKVIIS